MTFAPMILPVLAAMAILWGVGGFLAWAVGLRGYWIAAVAPVFSLTLIGGSAVVASWVGVAWSILPLLMISAAAGAGIYVVRRRTSPRAPVAQERPRLDPWLVLALVLAASAIAFRFAQIVQNPANISQTFDNIFHLNGVRWAVAEGDASSLRLGYMTSPDGSLPFYPAAWHALTALVVQITGASVPVAINAVVLTTSALVWPLGAVLLVRTLFGTSSVLTVAAALIAASIPAFPILLMDYGVLYPLQLSLAVLPVALAATARLLRVASADVVPAGTGWWVFIHLGIIPGLTLAHPGGFVAWMALTFPMFAVAFVRAMRNGGLRTRAILVASAVAYVVVGYLLVRVLRPPLEARGWPLQMRGREAIWQVLTVSPWYLVPAVGIALCVLAGLVWAAIDRTRPLVVAVGVYVIGAGLFITVAALPYPGLRDWLTGSWYNNLPRLASIFAVSLVPLAAYGAARTWQWASSRIAKPRSEAPSTSWLRTAGGVVGAAVFLVVLQVDGAVNRAVEWAAPLYEAEASAPLLSSDEYALLERLPNEVPEGVAVAGSPWTGASLAFAIADRPVLMPHTLMFVTPEVQEVNDGLADAVPGAPVCDAIRDLEVGYVLDFGPQEVHGGEHDLPGLEDLENSPAVELVDAEGDAKLYRVVGCG